MGIERNDFPFHHGDRALSFAGTVRDRDSEPVERIRDRAALVGWLVAAGLLQAPSSTREAPSLDAPTFATAIALREAIARASVAFVDGARPERADIETINLVAERWSAALVLDPQSLTLATTRDDAVKAALGRVARSAVKLFADPERRERLRRCERAGCGSIFLDPPGGRARRWCSMTRCGNRAKVNAHRARAKHEGLT